MKPLTLLTVLLLSAYSYGQTVDFKSFEDKKFEAITAKSVKVEQLTDSVFVLLTDRQPGITTGGLLTVTSMKKWATPYLENVTITQTSAPGEWILFTAPGKYNILLIEFDPETGPSLSNHEIVVAGNKPPPVDQPPPPPIRGFAELQKVAKEGAAKLNDPPTQKALAGVYRVVLKQIDGLNYDESLKIVQSARRLALQARRGESRDKDWNTWLTDVEREMKKVVAVGDKENYVLAVMAIVTALE